MKPRTASRYAVFLILLVLGQEFCAALREAQQSKSLDGREDNRENALEGKSRQKRAYTIVLLAITLSVSAAGVGFEIFNKVKGCCGTFPDACRYAREIEALRKSFANKTEEVDKKFLKAKNLKEDVIQANYHINEMWIDLLSIGRYQEDVIKTLSPGTIKKFQRKWAEIERELKNGNATVRGWTYDQINLQFQSYLDNIYTAIGGTSKLVSNTISIIYSVSQHYYKINQLNKMINQLSTGQSYRQLVLARHTKAARTLGVNDVGMNKFIKDTAASRINVKFASKYTFFYNAYYVVGTLISVGFDIWRAMQSIQACRDKRDKVKELRDKWAKADKEMDNIKTNAINYYNLLKNKGWKYVKSNLTDPNLIKSLQSLKTMATAAKPQTADLKKAGTNIGTFISQINSSVDDYTKTYRLQADLIEGLMTVKLLLQCTTARTEFLFYVSELCKKGLNSLSGIYASGKTKFLVKGADCLTAVGVTDVVQLQDMEKLIAEKAKKETYQKDCILNNPDKKSNACWLRSQGFINLIIANKMKLTLDQVNYLTSNCPQILSAVDSAKICFYRKLGASNAAIKSNVFPHISLSAITAVKC